MSLYFVVCIGRSGSKWLSGLLDQAEGHTCAHEEGDPRDKVTPQPWTPFPIRRWLGRDSYGEVNGMLRYHLSAQALGAEMEIPQRVYLRRDPLDIIASWMTQGRRDESELSATCHEVMWHASNLRAWALASQSRIVDVEGLWDSREATQELVDWLLPGGGLEVTSEMMRATNAGNRRARNAWAWTPDRRAVASRAAARVGYDLALSGDTAPRGPQGGGERRRQYLATNKPLP